MYFSVNKLRKKNCILRLLDLFIGFLNGESKIDDKNNLIIYVRFLCNFLFRIIKGYSIRKKARTQ